MVYHACSVRFVVLDETWAIPLSNRRVFEIISPISDNLRTLKPSVIFCAIYNFGRWMLRCEIDGVEGLGDLCTGVEGGSQ